MAFFIVSPVVDTLGARDRIEGTINNYHEIRVQYGCNHMVAFGRILAAPAQSMLADGPKNCIILMNKTY